MTDETHPLPNGRAEPDQVSDTFFRNAMIMLVIGMLVAIGVFASVAWRGSTYDRHTGDTTTQID